ncbi:hemicentin-2-like isoform X2 [Elgaria multicarinata webbii]|uniref:hemicentin-2-like isoform X2 n=1 Tax=Elgaria multicarinata webbii TaxID=159646 RepID=UPI002FCD491E
MHPCYVAIHPEETAVEFGGSVNLNCTFSCTNYTNMKWEAPLKHVNLKGVGWISLSIASVTEWSLEPICEVKGESMQHLAKAVTYVYQFSTPDIYLASEVVDGRSQSITCNVSSLRVGDSIPPNINISLTRGGKILNSTHGYPSAAYSFVANFQQDDGSEILCMASVQVGSEVLEKSVNRTLRIVASPYNVSVSTKVRTYKAGAHIVVTCNAKGKPSPEFSWDLPCKDGVEFSDNSKTVTIRSAESFHNGTYRCLAHNRYGKSLAEVDILFEDKSRSWITALVVVSLLAVVFIAGLFWYHCRK